MKETIAITGARADVAVQRAEESKNQNCTPFINCINQINNVQVDNAEYSYIEVLVYNVIEHSDNYPIYYEVYGNNAQILQLTTLQIQGAVL